MGLGSPPRLPKIQSVITGVKTPCIEAFFIPLKRSWSVDIQNGLAWAIWTYAAQVMCRKKGPESNWQFDSRSLKVGIRPDSGACRWSATHRWKAFKESYNFGLDVVSIRFWGKKLWAPKVPRVQTGTVSGLHFGSPRKKKPFGCKCGGELQRILYGGRWWLSPSPGCGESSESKVARGLSQHQKDVEWVLTNLLVGFGCRTI
jgi:hypothetical protein